MGVPQNHVEAMKWYRKAAKQSYLGVAYDNGEGVPEDSVQAYAWFSVCAAKTSEYGYSGDAKKNKGILKKSMTPAQIAEAQKLSSELWEKYVVPFQ